MDAREAHVERCKELAREYLAQGDVMNAVTSMLSDMGKRQDTKPNSTLALLGMRIIMDRDRPAAERFIEGFH